MGRSRRKHKNKFPEGSNWHHRKPKVHGGSGDLASGNMIHVCRKKHAAWHILFETVTPQQVARRINETWLDPDWELVARRKK